MRRRLASPGLTLALLCVLGAPCHAGGGPETTLVVVNERSPASLEVANHYVSLRSIPATHVCPLRTVPSTGTITAAQFRERIWAPIEAFMVAHGIADQIDTIAYSADFPFAVNYDADFEGRTLPQGANKFRVASLTGMTYLVRMVKAKDEEYVSLSSNRYCRWVGRGPQGHEGPLPSRAFSSDVVWTRDREPVRPAENDDLHRYYLATMLGHTGIQGNTVGEIRHYLERGAKSDGRPPKGTVYLMQHKDVRARTRMPFFAKTVLELDRRGVKARVLAQGKDRQDGKLPVTKSDVAGCVAGIAGFDWQSAGSEFCDGAIAEHLTSFGARFDGSSQTKISEFLRYGAVGSAGAVAEPYALHPKFPLPFLHVHYADGCCLAEAFYQAVAGPYQLLVLGDPLARPYATFASVQLRGPETKDAWTGTVALAVEATPAEGTEVGGVEIWLDGVRIARAEPGASIELDTGAHADGHHEIRAVAVQAGPVGTRSSGWAWAQFDNHGHKVTIKAPRKPTALGDEASLSGKASKARQVELLHGHRLLGEARLVGSTWKAKIAADALGVGTCEVQARATYEDGTQALSEPVLVHVSSPVSRKKARTRRGKRAKGRSGKGTPGLEATVTDAKGAKKVFPVEMVGRLGKKHFLKRLRSMVRAGAKRIALRGELQIAEQGLYQLAINAQGTLKIDVRGKTVFEAEDLAWDVQRYASLPLRAGWHDVEVDYTPAGEGDLSLLLGGAQVAEPLGAKNTRH